MKISLFGFQEMLNVPLTFFRCPATVLVLAALACSPVPAVEVTDSQPDLALTAFSEVRDRVLGQCSLRCRVVMLDRVVRVVPTYPMYPEIDRPLDHELVAKSIEPLEQPDIQINLVDSNRRTHEADTVAITVALISRARSKPGILQISVVAGIPRSTYVSWVVELERDRDTWKRRKIYLYHDGM